MRTIASLTFGNWLSGTYLGLAGFLLLAGAGEDGSLGAGLFALFLAGPTGAALLSVANTAGTWAQTDATVWCILLFSYAFQAFLLGVLVRAVRRFVESGRTACPAGDELSTTSRL
ncbi:SCO4225 family membrane protein [Streptomyces sp. MUM 178J]|uniref:SCO4225 family membrane protein n=1 Tax=Streptomyces sp. MUM 178J TaxID=2791991 RepID=UPI001F04C7DD|nr:hypothetical protein [Streptomyces sp. MUM 178J]WRQ81708.1 hypothetical protein I3F59_021405 [Streptomyces sp. MUM 178J]